MEIHITGQGRNEPPKLQLKMPLGDFTDIESMHFCVIEGGMASGEPSVIIAVEDSECSVALQTSLDKFIAAGVGMIAYAEGHWGWKRPEGSVTLLPPMDKQARKELLLSLQKELQEWDDIETN